MHECPDLGAKGEASAAGGEASGAGGEALGAGREASGAGREASAAGRAIQWLRGAGDGGGHLDSEEEEAPQPMLTVPEDLESWEAMVHFLRPQGKGLHSTSLPVCSVCAPTRMLTSCPQVAFSTPPEPVPRRSRHGYESK
ncbi:uncharacterized protein LOC116275752 isoform X2 [Papio anubis]|uniref:uncharacterized protein LOC116275752 isoform X2 n=1 Tax=Papio anubis TaxID=9555 RepID=UPI0012AD6465|nr:uncharacterized protein LOC116275752 isoform X2 [Papio anubis]